MSKWGKVLAGLRIGAAIAITKGLKVKGVPVKVIVDEVEADAPAVVESIKRIKAAKPKPVVGSTGE